MAKTIKELANEYAYHYEADDDAAYRGYVAGANAVLEEIESIAFSDVGSYKGILDKIQNKIKELKEL